MTTHSPADEAAWRESVVRAVDIVLGDNEGPGEALWVSLGSARPSEEPGWFTLPEVGKKLSPTARLCFGDERFGGDDDPAASIYSVSGFYQDPNGYHFQASRDVPLTHRQIWYRQEPRGAMLRSIKELLSQAGDAQLADDLAKRVIQPVLDRDQPAKGLTPDQARAYGCCFEPGVRFVWGPPGAGKTRVLARALADLIDSGKRVLLVSVANIAVDNALIKLVTDTEREPGTVVRAGQAQLPELRARAEVLLPALAQEQTRAAEGKAKGLEASLSTLIGRNTAALQALRQFIVNFDHDELVLARQAVIREQNRHELVRQSDMLLGQLNRAHREAEAAWQQDETSRSDLAAASVARQHLDAREREGADAAAKSTELERQRRRHQELEQAAADRRSWFARIIRGRRSRRELEQSSATLALLESEVDASYSRAAEHARRALPYTAVHLEALDRRAAETASQLERLSRTERELERQRDAVEASLKRTEREPRPTADQRDLVARAEAGGYDHKREELERLERDEERAVRDLAAVEQQLAAALQELEELRKDAEGEILKGARVVATTLTYARMRAAIKRARFDVVLIDEAGMASMADVLSVLTLGTETAVLFGDFLQLPPVFAPPNHLKRPSRTSELAHAKRWLGTNAFDHVGIHTPSAAVDHHGCVTMVHQFRFGSALRRFANELIYEVLADGDSLEGIPANPNTEVVVIDVADLGGLETVIRPEGRHSGWTTGGALISRAVAKAHVGRGETVGVITPYRHQADATKAVFHDDPDCARIPVGTVHAFQGTEYDAAVFDLVEDGAGWMAKARRDVDGGYADDGLRLAAVASTRARQRLYLLVNLEATKSVADKRRSQLLHLIHRNVAAGAFRTWSAAELLGLAPQRAGADASVFGAVQRELSKMVRAEQILDEWSFHSALADELQKARESIWMWAPWVARRFRDIEPHLQAAIERGVTVTIFMRTEKTHGQPRSRPYVDAALALDATVIRSHKEHRKVVVVDREVTIMGSLNPLSATTDSREVMVLFRGAAYAQRVLDELKAEQQSKPPTCSRCRGPTYLWRSTSQKKHDYFWRCEQCKEEQTKI